MTVTEAAPMFATISRLLHPRSAPSEPDRPRWVTSPAGAHCALCGHRVARGTPTLWLPLSTQRFCPPCGHAYLRSSWSAQLAA
jgi:hypothetical protein